ncbi:MAG: penicillin-binding protein activator [Syntrophaceae bacterium]|nr:penicillin-binding protein activator [Syntrophaceae bacterium]
MKTNRKFEKILFLLLIIFIVLLFETAFAAEGIAVLAPTEAKSATVVTLKNAPVPAISSLGRVNRNTIGCVLPLSGKYAEWGKKALDAIMLSARINSSKAKGDWEVIAEDSQGEPDKARQAVANLAGVKNVMAIIAIDEKKNALETAVKANELKVPVILITSKEGVTSAGEYVFQHFLTPTQEIRALVKYALNYLNCAIFSVFYPKDEYGEEMVKIFTREVKNVGGKVEKAIPYNINQTDFIGEINKLIGSVVKIPSQATQDDKQGKVPVDFEALFIPDSFLQVKMITSQLNFFNVKGFVLLGTSLLNSPNLLKGGAEFMEGTVFVDSFCKYSLYPETYNFIDLYVAVYNREPEKIEALAFDTAGMIFAVLNNEKIKTRRDLATKLSESGNYNGVTGNTCFDSNRVAQKTPFILKVKKERIEQIK